MASLQDFITETFSQIIQGVAAANEIAKKHGGVVNPSGMTTRGSSTSFGRFDSATGAPVEEVRFELAVTAEDVDRGNGNMGVKIVVSPVTKGEASENEAVSRLIFRIPLLYPAGSPPVPAPVGVPQATKFDAPKPMRR